MHQKITLSGPKFGARLYLAGGFFPRLSPVDKDRLKSTIFTPPGKNLRSLTFSLERPVSADGRTILSLRCKGIAPQATDGPIIPAHYEDGYVSHPLGVNAGGKLQILPETLSPEGTNSRERVLAEQGAAEALGKLTDLPIGYGFYEGLSFKDEPVGFNIYGMEAKSDIRLYRDLIRRTVEEAANAGISPNWTLMKKNLPEYFSSFGRLLYQMHQRGFAHRYPHQDNVGLLGNNPARLLLRDLDTAKKTDEMSPEQRFGYLLLDLSRAIYDLINLIRYDQGEGEPWGYLSLTEYVAPFLSGYFGISLCVNFRPLELAVFHMRKQQLNVVLAEWVLRNSDPQIRYVGEELAKKFIPELEIQQSSPAV